MIKYVAKLKFAALLVYPAKVIVFSLQPIISLFFTKYILDALTAHQYVQAVQWITAMVIITFILSTLQSLLQDMWSHYYNYLSSMIGRGHLDKSINCKYELIEDNDFLDLQQKVRDNIAPTDYMMFISDLIEKLIQLSVYIYLIITFNFYLLLGIFAINLINLLIIKKTNKEEFIHNQLIAPISRKINYYFSCSSNLIYAKEVRMNHMNNLLSDKLQASFGEYIGQIKQYYKKYSFLNLLLLFLSFSGEALLYYILIASVLKGELTIGSFSMYFMVFANFMSNLHSVMLRVDQFEYWSKNITLLKDYENKAKEDNDNSDIAEVTLANYDIEFKNVSFRYPGQESYALKDINVKINTGEKIAIVGLNGAGKTTFIKLLCKLYKPTEGEILINGTNIYNISSTAYFKLLGVILQDYKLFAYSIQENIILDRELNDELLKRCASLSMMDEKIESLKHAWNTTIYKEFDQEGVEFSGGEIQKLALAKALYRSPEILLLDEPNSAMDPLSEQKFYQNFREFTQNKTAIYISHRLSSTRFCDTVLVFENGRIIESGSHEALMKTAKLYAELFEVQANNYIQIPGDNL